MFDLDSVLLSPDRRPIRLGEIAGRRGLIVVGVGRGGERGFQMVHRFHDAGEQLAATGIHLIFVYPRESARHVLDPISVASARFRPHPRLLLDADGGGFARGVTPRSLTAVYLNSDMRRLAGIDIDLYDSAWETGFRAFLTCCQTGASH